eukprot:15350545-Ditylum_brightwellii.AAC.2
MDTRTAALFKQYISGVTQKLTVIGIIKNGSFIIGPKKEQESGNRGGEKSLLSNNVDDDPSSTLEILMGQQLTAITGNKPD